MSKRRESGQALVQRLRATHVRLLPHIFHGATDGGLRQGDALLVAGDVGVGKSSWAHTIAARHLSDGGAVTFLFFPGSGTFPLRRFIERFERIAAEKESAGGEHFASHSTNPTPPDIGDLLAARRAALLAALSRLEVVHCADLADVAVYCTASRAPDAPTGAVPLVVVEGCGGRGSYVYHCERAAGREAPLVDWLFAALQRRRQCALLLLEECPARGEAEAEASVAGDSDVLRRLQGGSARASLFGGLRVFVLHVQRVAQTPGHTATVAQLWRLKAVEERDAPDGTRRASAAAWTEGAATSKDGSWQRRVRWQQRPERGPKLHSEILCGAQLWGSGGGR